MAQQNQSQSTEGVAFVVLLGALAALPPLSIDVSLPGLPTIARALNAPEALLQQTLSAFIFAFGAGQLLVGPLSDRYGRRVILLGGLAIFAIASLACALATEAHGLIAWRLVQGFGACAGTVSARAIVSDVAENRARAASLQAYVSAVTAVAPIIAPIVGVGILTAFGWRALYGVLVLVGLLLIIAVTVRLPETSSHAARGAIAAYTRVLRRSRTIPLTVLVGCGFGGYFALISGSPSVLVTQFRLETTPYAIAFALNASALLLGAFAGGQLAKRMEPERLFAIGVIGGCMAGVLVYVVNVFVPSPIGFVVAMAAYAFAFGISNPGAYAAGTSNTGADAGVASALLGSAQMIGGALGSAAVGVVGGVPSVAVGIVVLAASVGSGVAYGLSRRFK